MRGVPEVDDVRSPAADAAAASVDVEELLAYAQALIGAPSENPGGTEDEAASVAADILTSLGDGQDPDLETVSGHLTRDVVYAAPEWSLEEAAAAMVRGGFRHLIVIEGGETVGILSVRDIVRCWTDDGAICEVPASAVVG